MTDLPPLSDQQMTVVNGTGPSEFWCEKIRWKEQGDLTDDGSPVFRVDGHHYVAMPNSRGERTFLGHGGHKFRFRRLDGSVMESNNVWHQGKIPLGLRDVLYDNAELVPDHPPTRDVFGCPIEITMPPATEQEAVMRNLCPWPLKTYAVDWSFRAATTEDGKYDITETDESRQEAPLDQSQVYSSEIAEGPHAGKHILAIDVDHRSHLIETSTPGHYHLVIAVPMETSTMLEVVKILAHAGIVEMGYYLASSDPSRRATMLRLPWVPKDHIDAMQLEAERVHLRESDLPEDFNAIPGE